MKVHACHIVITYDFSDAFLLEIGPKINTIRKSLKTTFQQLNIPQGAPPETPRYLLKYQFGVIIICLYRIEIIVHPPLQINKSFVQSIEMSTQEALKILGILSGMELIYKWCGIVSEIEYKLSDNLSANKVVTPLFDNIFKIERKDKDLSSFQLQFGFFDEGVSKNFTLSGYEALDINIPLNPLGNFKFEIKPGEGKISESGLNVRLDINNKNSTENSTPDKDILVITEKCKTTFHDLPQLLKYEGLV